MCILVSMKHETRVLLHFSHIYIYQCKPHDLYCHNYMSKIH